MATIAAIRDGLKDRIATIDGLHGYDVWPDNVEPPAAIVVPKRGMYHQAMGNPGHTNLEFEVILLAAAVQRGYVRGQNAVDPYLDDAGSSSIKGAIEGDPTLGGIVTTTKVTGWRDYGSLSVNNETIVGGLEYWGAKLDVEVYP